MNSIMVRPLQALAMTVLASLFAPCGIAHAQDGNPSTDGVYVVSPSHPVWLVEQPYADSPALTASTFGDSAYGDYHAKAGLVISCSPQNPMAVLSLHITPQSLGVDIEPFHGKGATANGPLRITTGTRTAVDHSVNGIWTDVGVFQVGTIFSLSASLPRDELADWASDAARGQALKLSLAPAKEGGKPLTATLSLPVNNAGLKKAVQPCLDARQDHSNT